MDYKELQKNYPGLFQNDNAAIEIILDESAIRQWQESRRAELEKDEEPLSWAEIGVVYEDPYEMIVRDLVRFSDGRVGTYFREFSPLQLKGGYPVVILPYLEGNILVLEQFRHATRSWHYEIPRGYGEPGLSAEENARKELEEETGWVARALHYLGGLHSNTGVEGGEVKLFLAILDSKDAPVQTNKNGQEGIKKVHQFSLPGFESMMRDGKITDAFTLSAYARAKLQNLL